jgi:uncharacterized membrane protein
MTTVTAPKKIRKYVFLTIISAVIYGVVFSYFTFLRHAAFQSAAWDLGNFNQAFYNTLFGGKMFYYTADVYFSPSGSMFAIHISPILYLILPFYAVYPSPVTLLIIKSFAVGFAAVPLFLLASRLLESDKAGFLLALAYLLYSPLQGAIWFDFQQAAVFALFAFFAYFFLVEKNWKLYFPMMLLAVMVEEHLVVVMAILAAYYFSFHGRIKSLPSSLKKLKVNENTVAIMTIVICAVYLFVALLIKDGFPVDPNFSVVYKADDNFMIIGSSETFTLPLYALLNPQRAIDALAYDFFYKFFYIVLLFSPLLFIPLRNRFVVGITLVLLPFVLSNYRPYYTLGVHYAFYLVPLFFIAAIYGVRRLDPTGRIFTLKTMVVVGLLFTICTSPISSISKYFVQQSTAFYSPLEFSLDKNKESLNNLLKLIPPDGSVLTQNKIFPHVSSRTEAYIIPLVDYGKPDEMQRYVEQLLDKSDYVLLDLSSMTLMDESILDRVSQDSNRAVYALGGNALLFKRGFIGDPLNLHFTTTRTFLAYQDLTLSPSGSIIDDSSSPTGKVFLCPKGVPGCSSYGPYSYLLQGAYEVTFTIKIGDHDDRALGTLDVATNVGASILSSREVYGFELQTGKWTNITLPFSLPRLTTKLEFRYFNNGIAEAFVDRVTVKRISSAATARSNVKTLRVGDLTLHNGTVTVEGFLFHQRGVLNDTFWYGPFWPFSSGNYTATFVMRMDPAPTVQWQHVLDLRIKGRTGESTEYTMLNQRSLYTQDFMVNNNTSKWQSLQLNFTVRTPMIGVELIGLSPTPAYDLYLAYILIARVDIP